MSADRLAAGLTPTLFYLWLTERATDGDAVVGVTRSAFRCPVARYCREQLGVDTVVSTAQLVAPGPQGLPRATPAWVKRLVVAIDALGPAGSNVRASQVLRLMDELGLLRENGWVPWPKDDGS